MKLTLTVLTSGKSEGKTIPITLPQFVIGRDPECQLRPASALISKRHCAILTRGDRAFVQDFGSTNGTFVNDEPVQGERELRDQDQLKVGPLAFRVLLQRAAPAKPKPAAAKPPAEPSEDESVAAMLLSLGDDDSTSMDSRDVDEEGIPTGSTVMEALTPAALEAGPNSSAASKAGPHKATAGKAASTGDTSSAAKAILDKYIRRPRA
jgi:pSer/pThr/pTyr-binding forkhead associated (FHA) protein